MSKEYGKSPSTGCFCINSMVELAPHDEKFAILTREHQMYLSVIFQETLERGLRSGELDTGINAKDLAQTLVISLIGLTVFLKSRPDRVVIDNFVKQILTLVALS